jgi:hypothetical protein
MADELIPLNAFKSVVATLTGEEDQVYKAPTGVSTIILSAQITNSGTKTEEVVIKLAPNRIVPIPQVDGIINSGSFFSSSALITENKTFIEKEVAAYTRFNNNLQEIPFGFSSSRYEGYAETSVKAVTFDMINSGSTIRTNKAALSFYDKDGVLLIPDNQITASINAIKYTNTLAQQIILNESVTGSDDVDRLFQSQITQSFNTNLSAESGSSNIINQLFTVVSDIIEDPVTSVQTPVEFVTNFPIPQGDSFSPVVAGKLVLEEDYGLVFSGSTDLTVVLSILETANE